MAAMELTRVKNGLKLAAKTTGDLLETLAKLSGKLDPLVKVPIVGDMINEVQDVVYLLNDYYKGNYKTVPKVALLGCAAIIIYVASPIDIIPDNIPILGFVDDAFIIKGIISLCVGKELDKYREWKALQPDEACEDIPAAFPAEA